MSVARSCSAATSASWASVCCASVTRTSINVASPARKRSTSAVPVCSNAVDSASRVTHARASQADALGHADHVEGDLPTRSTGVDLEVSGFRLPLRIPSGRLVVAERLLELELNVSARSRPPVERTSHRAFSQRCEPDRLAQVGDREQVHAGAGLEHLTGTLTLVGGLPIGARRGRGRPER